MSDTESRSAVTRRPQIPLWFLLFVVPSVIAAGCAIYTTWDREARRQAELSTQFALAAQEHAAAQGRFARIQRLNAALEAKQEEWRNVGRVIFDVQHPPPILGLVSREQKYIDIPLIHPSIHFYTQAGDGDLRHLVARLMEIYPLAEPEIKYRILGCLKNLPDHVEAERLHAVRGVVHEFVEPLQEHRQPNVRAQVRAVLKAYELPVKETGWD